MLINHEHELLVLFLNHRRTYFALHFLFRKKSRKQKTKPASRVKMTARTMDTVSEERKSLLNSNL